MILVDYIFSLGAHSTRYVRSAKVYELRGGYNTHRSRRPLFATDVYIHIFMGGANELIQMRGREGPC